MVDPLMLLRLLAHERGRAIPVATTLHVSIQPHALILAPIAMAGEDASLHAYALGRMGVDPEVRSTPDPRNRDDQHALLAELDHELQAYVEQCADLEAFPQLWVPSLAAVRLLDVLSERLRRSREVEDRRLGSLLAYLSQRAEVAGQQTLLAATAVLSEHYVTGQAPGEDAHLGALLAWVDPPTGLHAMAAAREAEQEVLGIKTDPHLDRTVLAPLLDAYHAARRREDASATRAVSAEVHAALAPFTLHAYEATARAIQLLQGAGLPPLPDLERLEQRERRAFGSFWTWHEGGGTLPRSPSLAARTHAFLEREDAAEIYAAALLVGDTRARAIARARGEVLTGRVVASVPGAQPPTLLVESGQAGLQIRVGDVVYGGHDPRLALLVTDLALAGGRTRVALALVEGRTRVGVPAVGEALELLQARPDWGRLPRTRQLLSAQLAHLDAAPAPAPPPDRKPPADVLAAVEDLRHG